jgi:DNA-binding IclR family transcriptional regulator
MIGGQSEKRTNDVDTVQTTETTFDILELLSAEGGVTLTEVAEGLDLAASTAHRHLRTLLQRDYVVEDHGEYYPSLRFLEIGDLARRRREAFRLAEGTVEELAERTDERVQFITEQNDRAVYVFKAVGERAVETDTHIGKHVPLNASAAGLAILASMPEAGVEGVIERRGLPARTTRTISDRDPLYAELDAIRERGYSINDQGVVEGLRAIGAPLTGPDGELLGAISISGPIHRLEGDRLHEELPDTLLDSINELELRIQYL